MKILLFSFHYLLHSSMNRHKIAHSITKCYNCGNFGHYSNDCPRPKIQSACHKCGETGHKMADCPKPTMNTSSTCHKCGEPGHKMADCPYTTETAKCHRCGETGHKAVECKQPAQPKCHKCGGFGHKFAECPSTVTGTTKNIPILKNTLNTKLLLGKMWGQKSALLAPECEVYVLKTRFLDALLKKGLITMDELDERNRTPHIDIQGNQSVYEQLNGSEVVLCNSTLYVERNYISIQIAKKYHVTLVFKRGIIDHIEPVIDILSEIIVGINADRANDRVRSETVLEELATRLTCCACMTNNKCIKLTPCNHICLCEECIKTIMTGGVSGRKCPMCRTDIFEYERVYL